MEQDSGVKFTDEQWREFIGDFYSALYTNELQEDLRSTVKSIWQQLSWHDKDGKEITSALKELIDGRRSVGMSVDHFKRGTPEALFCGREDTDV
jgi:hypothetical protein